MGKWWHIHAKTLVSSDQNITYQLQFQIPIKSYAPLRLSYIFNLVYRFPEELSPDLTTAEREEAKTTWKSELDVKCGWGKKWEPDNVPGCVDPRGCT